VDPAGGLYEQLHQCRMQVLARHQRAGGRHHLQVARRHVARQVHHAARQRDRVQVAVAPRVGLSLFYFEQADAGRLQQHLHQGRLRRRDHRHGIRFAPEQRDHRGRKVVVAALDVVTLHVVGQQHPRDDAGSAAAAGTDFHAHALQLRKFREHAVACQLFRGVAAVEEPDRFVEHAAERHHRQFLLRPALLGGAQRFCRTALHEGDLHILLCILQQAQVFARSGGGSEHHLDTDALQFLLVALAEFGVGPLLGAGGEYHTLGRRGFQEVVGAGEQGDRQDEERPCGDQQFADRDQRIADDAGHGVSVALGEAA